MEWLGVWVLVTLAICGGYWLIRTLIVGTYRWLRTPFPQPGGPPRPVTVHKRHDGWWVLHREEREMFGPYTWRQASALASWMQAGIADSRTREQVLEDAGRTV